MEPFEPPEQDLQPIAELIAIALPLLSEARDLAAEAGWEWNEAAAAWVDADGTQVSVDEMEVLIESAVSQVDARLADVVAQLESDGNLTAWENAIVPELARLIAEAFGLGRGGVDAITAEDFEHLEERLTTQIGFLRGFSEAILAGGLALSAIASRLELYTQDDRIALWEGADRAHSQELWPYYRNILGGCQHCRECPDLTDRGWVERGTLPPIGGRECVWRCCCKFEYGTESMATQSLLGGARWGWLGGSSILGVDDSPVEAEQVDQQQDQVTQQASAAVPPTPQELEGMRQAALAYELSKMSAADLQRVMAQAVEYGCEQGTAKALNSALVRQEESPVSMAPTMGYMGEPTDEQMPKILALLPKGQKPTKEELMVMSISASDNFVDFSRRRWHPNILSMMTCGIHGHIGKPLMIDHSWGTVGANQGFIFDQEIVTQSMAPEDAMYRAGYEEYNKAILEGEGYRWLHLQGVVPRSNEIAVENLKNRIWKYVSTGGLLFDFRYICPDCTRAHGREIGFFDVGMDDKYICPHYIPWGFEADDPEYASYAILDAAIYSSRELSFVDMGCLPGAQVL